MVTTSLRVYLMRPAARRGESSNYKLTVGDQRQGTRADCSLR